MKIIDISQTLSNNTPVWPGDTPFSFKLNWTKEESGSVNVGTFTMSAHTGTHIDAPYHFSNDGSRVSQLPLNSYIGTALVVDVRSTSSISLQTISDIEFNKIEMILFKTNSWVDQTKFPESITFLEAEIAPFLKANGIRLVGVDVPSVDPLDSKTLDAHHALHKNDIAILEGLVLTDVQPGCYELIALPLKIEGADGCPVRAVLIER
ncbi:arylformamidase [Halalkalibacter akibai]|uniref:Kynurenine formamidase n=1 Tax=Halalkalibacter akibai (strain ATCC 43226 / DSM 21942 / CIP 109018 / JCM 9157 / 1139) TaxID=1236973 RepID=W4R209_HALA3|nr:arylformamidase [Halalkalibacter akibai]GAE37584.1 kynurenine formamidase [Halalkalibacter akibai JCM 9157]